MKKALITLLLTIIMSAGIIFSADLTQAKAATIPYVYELDTQENRGIIKINNDSLKNAIVEYTFYSNDILFSKLENFNLVYELCEIGTDKHHYSFSLPEGTLSFKVWRVVTNDKTILSLSGDNELNIQEGTGIEDVETRIKTLIINDDLVTKEPVYSGLAGIANFAFKMHFNVEDAEGNNVPIDHIYSLEVEFNVIKTTFWVITTEQFQSKLIKPTEQRNYFMWPFLYSDTIVNSIEPSNDSQNRFDWMFDLGTYSISVVPGASITVDDTTVIKISYFYNGVFYNDIDVIDEPYDSDDVITVKPGTTDPITSIIDWIAQVGSTLKFILIAVVALIALVVISLVFKTFSFIKSLLVGGYKLIILLFKLIKYIIFGIPKAIINFVVFLFIPKAQRKENRNVSRYI